MVITVICQVYPNITIAVNAGYFADAGDDELQKQQEEKNQILRKIQLIRIKLKVLMIWKKTK